MTRALKLSLREVQIIRCLFKDRTEAAIAGDLGISEHTVHIHLNRLFKKLRVGSRLQVVLRVVQWFLMLTTFETGSTDSFAAFMLMATVG